MELDYADDIWFLSDRWRKIQEKHNDLVREARVRSKDKLQSSKKKNKLMRNSGHDEKFTIDHQLIEDVQEFIYLESVIGR